MYGAREIEFAVSVPVSLCSLADVKSALSITGGTFDTMLTGLIASASAAFEAYCGTPIGARALVERIRSYDAASLAVLTYAPAATLTQVKFNSVTQLLGDFRLNAQYGTLTRVDGENCAAGEWEFSYSAGFAVVPQAIATAALMYVKSIYNSSQGKGAPAAIAEESTPGVGSVVYRDVDAMTLTRNGVALPADVALLLAPYVRGL